MNHKIKKKPWPTQKAMIQIYEKKLWGISDTNTDFYSGEGSHKNEFVAPYLTHIISFLKSFNPPLRLLDLGCGDFNIGDKLTPYTASYTGVDIVPKLIERNQKIYQNKKVTFKCLDIAKDVLPVAHDCVIVRQVLHHLSNTAIKAVLPKLSK